MICKEGATINFIHKSTELKRIFDECLDFKIPCRSSIRKFIIDQANEIKENLKNEIAQKINDGETPVPEFDEWTSISGKQMIGLILNFGETKYHLGVSEILEESCDAVTIADHLKKYLLEYGVNIENLKYFVADGAAVNGAVARLTSMKIQKCQNHGLHLGISKKNMGETIFYIFGYIFLLGVVGKFIIFKISKLFSCVFSS